MMNSLSRKTLITFSKYNKLSREYSDKVVATLPMKKAIEIIEDGVFVAANFFQEYGSHPCIQVYFVGSGSSFSVIDPEFRAITQVLLSVANRTADETAYFKSTLSGKFLNHFRNSFNKQGKLLNGTLQTINRQTI